MQVHKPALPLPDGNGGRGLADWAAGGASRSAASPSLVPPRGSSPRGQARPHDPPTAASTAALAKSAHDFEAMAIGQLLAPMFDTVDTAHGAFGGGSAETAWKPMLVDAIARQVAARGGFGFAGPVYKALLRAQESQSEKTAP